MTAFLPLLLRSVGRRLALLLPMLLLLLLLLLLLAASCQNNAPAPDNTDYAARDQALITDYIKANSLPRFEARPSGLFVAATQPGTGDPAVAGQALTVLYTGYTLDGKVFDSTSGKQPFTFTVGRGQVIAGWDEGFIGLRPGSKAILLIPSDLAYGARANGAIQAHAVLRFDVELLGAQ